MDSLKVYVINMDHSKDRLQLMTSKLAAEGLAFERVAGSNECAARASGFPITATCSSFCPPGMIGCSHSHVKTWQRFLETDKPYALILEDDASFHPEFKTRVTEFLNSQTPFDMITLGCTSDCGAVYGSTYGAWIRFLAAIEWMTNPFKGKRDDPLIDGVHTMDFFIGAHAYIVSKQGAKKLTANLTNDGIMDNIDIHMARMTNLNKLAFVPSIANQLLAKNSSTIANGKKASIGNKNDAMGHVWNYPYIQLGESVLRAKHIVFIILATALTILLVPRRHKIKLILGAAALAALIAIAGKVQRKKMTRQKCQ